MMDLQEAIDRLFPLRDGLTILSAQIADHGDQLLPPERAAIEGAVEKRRREFSTGRVLARRAMGELNLPTGPILRGENREPHWPPETLGTITHAQDQAVVGVARQGVVRSLGLDLELVDRVGDGLHRRLFTDTELLALQDGDGRLAGILFSAKEAGYKATYPLVGRFIGFHDAEVDVDLNARRFRLKYLGDHPPNKVMEAAEGHFFFSGPYVLSLVIIPIDE
jgi:4'-phosphopantetheinyl transferase EntD